MLHALQDDLVNGVIVLKLNEAKAPFAARAFLGHVLNVDNVSKLAEVLLDVLVLQAVLDASHEDLLDCLRAFTLTDVITWGCSLGLHLLTIDGVGSLQLHGVHHAHL